MLDEIVLTDDKLIEVGKTSTIKKAEDIQNLPIRGTNGIAALTPGVQVGDDGQLRFRGARSGQNQTFIDGVNQRNLFIPFIILSASDNLKKIRLALSNGASGFIPKTNSAKQILAAIDQVMEGNVVIPPELKKQLKALDEMDPLEAVASEITQHYQLSERQLDVLKLIQKGCSNQEVAQILNISINTVKVHMRVLCEAFEAKNRNDCVSYAEKIGLLI